MKTDYKIELTYADIIKATPGSYNNCMHERAIERTIPRALYVKVKGREISFSLKETGLRYTFATPKVAHASLKEFDRVGPEGALKFLGQSYWLHLDEAETAPMERARDPQANRERVARYNALQVEVSPERKEQMRQARLKRMASQRRK